MSTDRSPTEKKLLQVQISFRTMIESCKGDNERFVETFEGNPRYALQWADWTFKVTARLQVFSEIDQMISGILKSKPEVEGGAYEFFVQWVQKAAIKRCSNLEHSTSVCSNLLSALEAETWAVVARNDFGSYF